MALAVDLRHSMIVVGRNPGERAMVSTASPVVCEGNLSLLDLVV